MYSEMMITMKMLGCLDRSRNGDVLTLEEPLTVAVENPCLRVLVDPIRNANPFFHLMEFVWMMAGEKDVGWLAQFNKKMYEFADGDLDLDIEPHIHGAYGHRWQHHFRINQIFEIIDMLKVDSNNRRIVLTMWDPSADLNTDHRDLPCNTHIYFRVVKRRLNMTVCNRSNDVIWGMTGANAVHMTLLHEFIASAIGINVGYYTVFTNNAHIYLDLPHVKEMLDTRYPVYPNPGRLESYPVLGRHEHPGDFIAECGQFLRGGTDRFMSPWLNNVAQPAHRLWFNREEESEIQDLAWRTACAEWLQRKATSVK